MPTPRAIDVSGDLCNTSRGAALGFITMRRDVSQWIDEFKFPKCRYCLTFEDEVSTGSGSGRVTSWQARFLLSVATRSLPLPVLTPSRQRQNKRLPQLRAASRHSIHSFR